MLYPLSYGGSVTDQRINAYERLGSTVVRPTPAAHTQGPSPPEAVHERGSQGSRV